MRKSVSYNKLQFTSSLHRNNAVVNSLSSNVPPPGMKSGQYFLNRLQGYLTKLKLNLLCKKRSIDVSTIAPKRLERKGGENLMMLSGISQPSGYLEEVKDHMHVNGL